MIPSNSAPPTTLRHVFQQIGPILGGISTPGQQPLENPARICWNHNGLESGGADLP